MLNAGLFLIAEVVSGNVQLRQGPIVLDGRGKDLGVIGIELILSNTEICDCRINP